MEQLYFTTNNDEKSAVKMWCICMSDNMSKDAVFLEKKTHTSHMMNAGIRKALFKYDNYKSLEIICFKGQVS